MQLIDMKKLVGFFQHLSPREKIILYLSIIAVVGVAADQLVLSPIRKNLQSLDQRTHDVETNIKRSIHLLGQKEKMMKEAEHYAAYVSPSKSSEDGVLILLKKVQELASQASVNLLYSKPGAGETKERNVYRVSLECEGQMDQLIGFFYAIENAKLFCRVEKYSLQPTAKGSSVIKCTATISMAGIP
jgi:hypothetical protein